VPRSLSTLFCAWAQRDRATSSIRLPFRVSRTALMITLQKGEAPRQCRLVDGQPRLELSEVRLAATCDGREDTELRHPEPARPEDIVVSSGRAARIQARSVRGGGSEDVLC